MASEREGLNWDAKFFFVAVNAASALLSTSLSRFWTVGSSAETAGRPVDPGAAGCPANFSTCKRNCRSCSSIWAICFFKFSTSEASGALKICANTSVALPPIPNTKTIIPMSTRSLGCARMPSPPVPNT